MANQYLPGMGAGQPTADVPMRRQQAPVVDNTFQKCPVCGRNIPVSEFNEHLRIEMLDPNYRNVKADAEARAQNITTVSGDDIAKNLKAFARHRPDILSADDQARFQEQGIILFLFKKILNELFSRPKGYLGRSIW